jgi:hypothetical protein
VYGALEARTNIVWALRRCKGELGRVRVNRVQAKPKVSIIGEFWAMTTEGDGNYQLQRFLEGEGAEVDVQLVTAWLLYMLWEARHDTQQRVHLRVADHAKSSLGAMGPFGVTKKLLGVQAADTAVRMIFQTFAQACGLSGYPLPNMDEIAQVSHQYYDNNVRGGEGHMEVGKLIMNVLHSKAHMTVSVKPFGCMPSAGVSDGVQSALSEKLPGAIFCPVETSGDGRVNFYSRIQMYLFKAKQAASSELEEACRTHGVTVAQVRDVLASDSGRSNALYKADHRYAGTAADVVADVAPLLTRSRAQRWIEHVRGLAVRSRRAVEVSPQSVVERVRSVSAGVPMIVERARVDALIIRDTWRARKRTSPEAIDSAAQ